MLEKIKGSLAAKRAKKVLFVLLGAFLLLVALRIPAAYERIETEEQVAKIHATKLTLVDVMGENLPPDPGEAADDTVEGIDANKNGIRDDVDIIKKVGTS